MFFGIWLSVFAAPPASTLRLPRGPFLGFGFRFSRLRLACALLFRMPDVVFHQLLFDGGYFSDLHVVFQHVAASNHSFLIQDSAFVPGTFPPSFQGSAFGSR
ncbi:unnamed protein product [Durusdinium trenchii]|uniref:Secreted protein n=1 Tax=Durusdinium trenchii TaxID=1381693 RepID=A0ABP0P351_9DINO